MQQTIPLLPKQRARTYPRRRFATMRAVVALMLREMATTYGRSPGGYLWAVLEPVGGIALLTLAFSFAFRAPPLGISFPMFYATGLIPFLLYMDISGKLGTALKFSRQLLVYPSVSYIDALIARFILNLLTQLMVAYIIFAGIMLLFETRVILDYTTILAGFSLAAFLGFSIGVMNAFLFLQFNVWEKFWSVLMRPMFLLSGIFLLPETIPEPFRSYLMYNPLVHVVSLMRRGFYPSYDAPDVSPVYVISVSGIALLFGMIFLKRHHRNILTN